VNIYSFAQKPAYSLNKIKKDSMVLNKDDILRALALKKNKDRLLVPQNRLDSLVYSHKGINKEASVVVGYRVQVAMGPKDSVYNWKERFLKKYPDISTYMTFSPPNFKLRVGDFYGPWAFWEANILANKLKEDFNSVFCVSEKINLEVLTEEYGNKKQDQGTD
tara:strand:- start:70 stop:558 length:489 start_codon:yes stop_codon:yes gene_type:complete